MIESQHVIRAILKWPSRYETRDGEVVIGDAVSRVPTALRDNGWKRVPRLDKHDLKKMGLRIVQAQYVGGARPTGKYIDVVVAK